MLIPQNLKNRMRHTGRECQNVLHEPPIVRDAETGRDGQPVRVRQLPMGSLRCEFLPLWNKPMPK